MGKMNRTTFILLVALCVISLIYVVFLFSTKRTIRKNHTMLQERMQKLVMNEKELSRLVRNLEETKKDIEKRLKKTEGDIQNLTMQLTEEKKKNADMNSSMGQKTTQIEQLKTDIKKYQEENAEITKHLDTLRKAFYDMKEVLDNTKKKSEDKIATLNTKIIEMSKKEEDGISLGTIVIKK